jgi:hypothetical protein
LPLGERYPADRCVRCGIGVKREKMREIVDIGGMARALECENYKRCMRRRRARRQAA